MSLTELLPEVEALPHADKVRLKYLIEKQLEDAELRQIFPEGQAIEIWSPLDSFDVATTMQKMLNAEKQNKE